MSLDSNTSAKKCCCLIGRFCLSPFLHPGFLLRGTRYLGRVAILVWPDDSPTDPAKSCPHPEPTHRPSLVSLSDPRPQTPPTHHALLRDESGVVRAIVAPAKSATDIRMPSSTAHARTRPAF